MPRQPVLSILRMPPGDPLTERTWHDTHLAHAKVLEWAADSQRVLWARPAKQILLIQSTRHVTPSNLPAGHHVTWRQVRTDWEPGTQIRWSLIANPAKAQPRRDGPDGRCTRPSPRVPLPPAQRDQWLHRKLGAALTITHMTGQPLGRRTGNRAGHHIVHELHCWAGHAVVADSHALAALITLGVGPGKAYGAGLLIVQEAA